MIYVIKVSKQFYPQEVSFHRISLYNIFAKYHKTFVAIESIYRTYVKSENRKNIT